MHNPHKVFTAYTTPAKGESLTEMPNRSYWRIRWVSDDQRSMSISLLDDNGVERSIEYVNIHRVNSMGDKYRISTTTTEIVAGIQL